jgi:hypothetical protein
MHSCVVYSTSTYFSALNVSHSITPGTHSPVYLLFRYRVETYESSVFLRFDISIYLYDVMRIENKRVLFA